jgi:ribosomal protein S18
MSRRADTKTTGRKRKPRTNPLDAAGITYIDYKDTNLLRKFISDRGKILPLPSRHRRHPPAAAPARPGHQERP